MANNKLILECVLLNKVFAAFFMHECAVKHNLNFDDYKPEMPNIKQLNEDQVYFTQYDTPYGLKHFYHGKVTIEKVDMQKFNSLSIYEFFDDEMKQKFVDLAEDFCMTANKNSQCDFVFSSLPDNPPFICDNILDPDSNFRSRLIIGTNLLENNTALVWEFYCLIMMKFREGEEHPIYGKTFKNLDHIDKQDMN